MSEAGRDGQDLRRKSITAMLWGTGGAAVRTLLQVASQIVLARLLGPELFGVFAVAMVVVLLSGLFADVGLAYGLIQKPAVAADDIRFVTTWQFIVGGLVSLLLVVAAPAIGSLYGDPRIATAVALLAPTCLVNAAAATSGALLRREMDFRSLNIASVASYAVGFVGVAIPMALAGAGVLALVGGLVVQATLQAAIQYARCRHPVRPLLWYAGASATLGFGLTVLATNLVNWAMAGIDRAIAGKALGVTAAGLYATAYNLVSTPLLTALSLLQSILYSASAKVQDDKAQLGRGLATVFAAVLLFGAPIFAGIAGTAETIFAALYGSKWVGGGAVLAPLALAMPAQLLMGLATPVLWASGATRTELQLQIPIALTWVCVLWLVAQAGSLALLGWAVALLFYVRAGVLIWATLRAIGLAPGHLIAACRPGLVVSGMVGGSSLIADRLFGGLVGNGLGLLAIDIAVCGAAMLLGFRLVASSISPDVLDLLHQLTRRLPGRVAQRLLALVLGRDGTVAPQA